MKRVVFVLILVCFSLLFAAETFALTVRTISVSSGIYEDGIFKPGDSGFEAEYTIDETRGMIVLKKIIKNNREGRVEEGEEYDITSSVVSKGISALLVSKDKKGQKIFTAVRETDLGVFVVMIFGDDFYEYSRASNGRFYLEYGEVEPVGK